MLSKLRYLGNQISYHGRNTKGLIHNDRWIEEPFSWQKLANVMWGKEAMVEDRQKKKPRGGSRGGPVVCVDVNNWVAG